MLLQRAAADLISFSALALALAAIGIYGVVAYRREPADARVRRALGATPRDLAVGGAAARRPDDRRGHCLGVGGAPGFVSTDGEL